MHVVMSYVIVCNHSTNTMACTLLSQDVVMMCQEVEKAFDQKLQDMPAQVSSHVVGWSYM